ncbi:aflatoxin b1 aldehyde reductase member 3 [Trichoderma arundinaceum]|uniref:Aflatoxin b1 aldehyde reductase member 3 n=1 Tax=Trichoderma arundinaceum TaxID=490622 RepID=A0A395NU83_TRIAR|nr:aflatoxin b1 aldehyde reductase member 3 [Trichoderma arundinaceum]
MGSQPNSALRVVFGAMTLGEKGSNQARVHTLEECAEILDVFQQFGHSEVDTARVYGGGSSERFLGQLDWQKRGIVMDTKLSPTNGQYNHTPAGVRDGLLASFKALGAEKVDMWYLHAPDHDTPYEDTLREVNKLYEEGYFKRFGISNYSAWETAQICEICIRNGWKKPDVYQGVYNGLHRAVEPELFPCLRYYGIAFYQYNPLAGGILTDKYKFDFSDHEEGSRFDPSRAQGVNYRQRYWNETYFKALDTVRPVAAKLGISTAEAALRWSLHHSLMKKEHGDAVIIGASSAQQLKENLTNLEKGPLPDELVAAFDEGWAVAKAVCRPYFR